MLETSNFVHGSTMRSLSLVMSKCSLSGRGQGHVSNFYIVDLENFTTASRRYTGDIHNTSVVGLFMTSIRQRKLLDRVMVECTCAHRPSVTLQLHNFDLFRTRRTSGFCTVAWGYIHIGPWSLRSSVTSVLGPKYTSISVFSQFGPRSFRSLGPK